MRSQETWKISYQEPPHTSLDVLISSQEDCTTSRWRCSKNTWRLTSSVNITSEPAAISCALLYVADGFNFAKRNLACPKFYKKEYISIRRQLNIASLLRPRTVSKPHIYIYISDEKIISIIIPVCKSIPFPQQKGNKRSKTIYQNVNHQYPYKQKKRIS